MLNLYCTDPMLRCQASQMWMKSVTLKQLSIIAVLAALSHLTFWPQLAARVAYSCTAEENANKEPAARATLLVVVERPCCKYLASAAKISPKCIIVAFCLHSHEPKPAFACNTVLFFPLLLAFSTCQLICGGMSRFHLRSSFHNKPEFAGSSQALQNLWFMCSCSQSTPYCKRKLKVQLAFAPFCFLQ